MFQQIKNKLGYLILVGLLAGSIFIWQSVLAQPSGDKLELFFFDVGQGSSILINAPNGNQVLIDGGPSDAVLAKLGEVLPFFDREIELIILTHPDADHLSGLVEVLKRYQVGKILETGIVNETAENKIWKRLIADKKITVVRAQAGQNIKIADDLNINILAPFGDIAGQNFGDNINNTSVAGKIIYGQNKILFTGDAEKAEEWQIIQNFGNLIQADILQVGHHGSKNSSSAEFLAAVAPQIAVIQVGAKNSYGHPAPEVLDRLKSIKTFRTDQDGDVIFFCDLASCHSEN